MKEAIKTATGARVDDELSVRDRSLIVVAALITQGAVEAPAVALTAPR